MGHQNPYGQQPCAEQKLSNILGLASFVIAMTAGRFHQPIIYIVLSVVAIVLSIVSIIKTPKKLSGFAIAGLAIAIIGLASSVYYSLLYDGSLF